MRSATVISSFSAANSSSIPGKARQRSAEAAGEYRAECGVGISGARCAVCAMCA